MRGYQLLVLYLATALLPTGASPPPPNTALTFAAEASGTTQADDTFWVGKCGAIPVEALFVRLAMGKVTAIRRFGWVWVGLIGRLSVGSRCAMRRRTSVYYRSHTTTHTHQHQSHTHTHTHNPTNNQTNKHYIASYLEFHSNYSFTLRISPFYCVVFTCFMIYSSLLFFVQLYIPSGPNWADA